MLVTISILLFLLANVVLCSCPLEIIFRHINNYRRGFQRDSLSKFATRVVPEISWLLLSLDPPVKI